jgi:protein-S-isoprenylcysteine O-methyltransferase Ste14
VRAILLLPGLVAVAVPAIVIWRLRGTTGGTTVGWGLPDGLAVLSVLLGIGLIVFGLALVAWTVRLFVTVGHGTLAPWDATTKLVVRGPYRHVRHPMIGGVGCVLAGETALAGSVPLLYWLGAFVAANAVYLPLVEEPGLRRRFGKDYDVYRAHVPGVIPRLRPWDPGP